MEPLHHCDNDLHRPNFVHLQSNRIQRHGVYLAPCGVNVKWFEVDVCSALAAKLQIKHAKPCGYDLSHAALDDRFDSALRFVDRR